MPDIYWLIKAQRRFQEAMTPPMAAGVVAGIFTSVCERLAATFPKAKAVIVRDRLRGFRNYRDRHILLVEVIHRTQRIAIAPATAPSGGGPQGSNAGTECMIIWPGFCEPKRGERTQTSAHIVKIADDPEVLSKELDAWERCRPVGMMHDSILMRLRPGARGPGGELRSILYEDAHHVIGAGLVIFLEEAVIDCCVWGTPTVASIELLLCVLYEHFGDDFYTRSWVVETPTEYDLRLMLALDGVDAMPKEGKNLIIVAEIHNALYIRICDGVGKMVVDTDEKKLTNQTAQIEALRKQLANLWPPHALTKKDLCRIVPVVTSIVGHTPPTDNLTRLRAWKRFDTWLEKWKDKLEVGNEPQLDRLKIRREVLAMLSYKRNCLIDPVDYLRSVQECPEFCPLLLWGCAHGDLHGRNMLVTVLDDAVTLPAVFDYADMGLENLVGWDFVKLETELKVRVLPQLLDGPEADYFFTVLKFECFLASYTNAMHNQAELPKATFKPEGLNRLAAILLAIRRQAQRHMGVQRLRDRQWLEEYYFLLACYGAYAGLFDAYQSKRRQLAAAYISAGVAARQLARPTQRLNELIREAEVKAQGFIDEPEPGFAPERHQLPKDKCEMSYHARLAFARKWVGSRKEGYRDGAIKILDDLKQDYPHVLEIEDEQALAYLEANKPQEFERLLAKVNARYGQLSEEFLCRVGRFWKNKGDGVRTGGNREGARRDYETALDWYRRAYAIRVNYYPGINVAALAFVLGKTDQAKQAAEAVLRSVTGSTPAEDLVWIRATQADAQLLLDDHEEGERLYRQARDLSDPRGQASMRRQVELLLVYAPQDSAMRRYWTPAKLSDVFGD